MSTHTDYQTIHHDGKPAFVLVPVAEFERIKPLLERDAISDVIPQAIVEAHVLNDIPLIRAWREHLGLTQEELSAKAGMAQSALARLERGTSKPRTATFAALANAMGLTVTQLQG
jgi:DNA-binding XRE family transcriptional regulator